MHSYINIQGNQEDRPNYGIVFLRSSYTDITQHTNIQTSMLTEKMSEKIVDVSSVSALYSVPDVIQVICT